MNRFVALAVLIVIGSLAGLSWSQDAPGDQPIRLKKKKKAEKEDKAVPDKPAKKESKAPDKKEAGQDKEKKEPAVDPPDDGANEREVMDRIARNVKKAEERLANRELGDATRQVQEDVLKDIDSLIKKASQPQDSSSSDSESGEGGDGDEGKDASQDKSQGKQGASGKGSPGSAGKQKGGSSSNSAGKTSRGKGGSRGNKQLSRGNPSGGSKSGSNEKEEKSKEAKSKGGQGGKQAKSGPNGNNSDGGKGKEGPPNKAADLYKDIWGHLPESLRQEMNAYFNDKQFMAKYDDLIKRYYSAIAEKGRPKGR